ncbi:phage portal protein [Paucilactobacillus hokkaidonensis]|uniref:phage portal protein n=1 Tax=Paucilactobacillus hokkaidonensis TaxID=1193095 RepID=UPI000B002E17|nr:phage portal protein [Paucilactobacillus hokkaidonensis]
MNPFRKFERNNIRSQTLTNGGYMPFVFSSDGQVITANTVNADNALKNSDIFAVINRIASDISACTFRVNEPFKQLLDNPNNLVNSYNFWQSVVSQLCLAGNCYVVITRDNQGVPTRLEQIPIDQVTITLEDSSKDITYTVNYNDERGTTKIKSANMLHFRLFVSGQVSTKYVGVSPLDSLVRELNLQDYSNKMSISMLKKMRLLLLTR